ncbi:ribonuclease HIII [Bacillus solimangrovi]|uniref:Ribonuclease HIII n=1 Tax=Bacillus solimangrovi TaxID=1305675 RepID=A0A1E5LCT0_9BACI|nr:ribonuclease HIII [Bacillus solimangrovi]OEH91887.1 ribonuclease HIII [Bacillus solimangrovi]
MSNSVIQTSIHTIEKMKAYYATSLQPKQPPGSIFAAKLTGCSITAYKSGKVLFQGKDAEAESARWGKQLQSKQKKAKSQHNYAPPATIANMSILGSDEVGTGDYFGPMTVVAAFVSKEQIPLLKELGVRDSKNLDDTQIARIAKEIMPIIPYSLLILHNEKYNELQASGMTQGKMKALLHNQAINHAVKKIERTQLDGILIDQFVQPATYFNHISGKKREWTEPIYFSTQAEGVHLSVAAASIIARYVFVREFEKLSEQAGFKLPKGAGHIVDKAAAKLIKLKGESALNQFTKYHFANTEKAKKLIY